MESQNPRFENLLWLPEAAKEAGYTLAALHELGELGMPGGMKLAEERLQHASVSPVFRTWARLLFLGQSVPVANVEAAFGVERLHSLEDAGMVIRSEGKIEPKASLIEVGGQLAFADLLVTELRPEPLSDHVLQYGNATRLVSFLAVRKPVDLALDLGTGQGILAMQEAEFASRVIATDISTRALDFARLNVAMNGISSVEFREGSFFEPVAREIGSFGVIVSNPPFIISPKASVSSFISNFKGDGAVEHLVRSAPSALAEGGFFTMIGSWMHGDDWSERVRSWLMDQPLDAMIMRFASVDGANYSRQMTEMDPGEASAQIGAILAEANAHSVAFGAIVLRKRTGTTWIRAENTRVETIAGPSSDIIERIFDNQTWLSEKDPSADLLEMKFKFVEGVRWIPIPEQVGKPVGFVQLQHTSGMARPLALPRPLVLRLETMTGKKTLGSLAGSLPGDTRQLGVLLNRVARQLLQNGFLVPV